MVKKLKAVIIILAVIIFSIFAYRLLFIRTVNYEIGGVTIPSEYNFLTGKARPISNYKGQAIKRTVEDRNANKIGLTDEQVMVAQLRWAVFEEWVKSRQEYKGWESNAEIFKKANDEFRKEVETRGPRFKIVK